MTWRPQLNVTCGRCGKPRGLSHVCVNGSRRKAALKPSVTFGKCPKCKKTVTNPLTHVCAPRSDFKGRKRKYEKDQKKGKKPRAERHDYQECSDNDCPRSLCVAYKKGFKAGDEAGFKRGWEQCYPIAFEDGIAHCPRPHK